MVMRFEQIFPRRRLYRTTITKTGTEVISTAIGKRFQSQQMPIAKDDAGEPTNGKYVCRNQSDNVRTVA